MGILVSILMAVRSLTFVASFVSSDSSSAHFSAPQIQIAQQEIRMTIQLEGAFPEELKKLAASGTVVPIYLYADLIQDGLEKPVFRNILESRLDYDFSLRRFQIIRSWTGDTLTIQYLDSALLYAGQFKQFPLFPVNLIRENKSYFISVSALLGKTRVDALNGHEMDLMYYWNFKRPSLRTEKFPGKTFLLKKR